MDTGRKEKLGRYLRNAERFMWGVIPGSKSVVFATLRALLTELGEDGALVPEHQKPTYASVTETLLAKVGIEKIITGIIVSQVQRHLADRPGALDFLRAHWMSGTLPRWQTLQSLRAPRTMRQKGLDAIETKDAPGVRQQTSDIIDAFLETNGQFNYVHGWTVFAGLWFEEIEPWLKEIAEERPN